MKNYDEAIQLLKDILYTGVSHKLWIKNAERVVAQYDEVHKNTLKNFGVKI